MLSSLQHHALSILECGPAGAAGTVCARAVRQALRLLLREEGQRVGRGQVGVAQAAAVSEAELPSPITNEGKSKRKISSTHFHY